MRICLHPQLVTAKVHPVTLIFRMKQKAHLQTHTHMKSFFT